MLEAYEARRRNRCFDEGRDFERALDDWGSIVNRQMIDQLARCYLRAGAKLFKKSSDLKQFCRSRLSRPCDPHAQDYIRDSQKCRYFWNTSIGIFNETHELTQKFIAV